MIAFNNKYNIVNKILNLASDLLFREKNRCFICGGKADYSSRDIDYICCGCFLELETNFYENCSKCGKKLRSQDQKLVRCFDCISSEYSFEKGSSPLRYEGKVRKIVTDFKYYDKPYYKKFLGEFMVYKAIEQSYDMLDLIIPVPMEEKKEITRGYNQAELLAQYVADKLNMEINSEILIRKDGFGSQKGLNKLQREANLRKAFEVKTDSVLFKDKNFTAVKDIKSKSLKNKNLNNNNRSIIHGRNILLIDDVYTTGSTVENCSRALKKQGAKAVYVLTAASTPCE